MFANPFKLAEIGILGMNERNINYISKYNPRALYPLVDDKLQTKQLLTDAKINVPSLISTVHQQIQVNNLIDLLPKQGGFAIKPAHGSGGKGILVILSQSEGTYTKSNGEPLSLKQLEHHCSNILAGLYSLGGRYDVALIENLIEFDPIFDGYSFEGVPDIRVIIFQGYPIMAMMRLSTKASDGKANLHQGAVGVGVSIATGEALNAVQFGKPIEFHPDTNKKLNELKIPDWQNLLTLAAQCYDHSNLGYLGVDIVLDKNIGPLVLELNARPGLSIQVANDQGLKPRLKLIEQQTELRDAAARVAFSREFIEVK
ncbi:alpha-L-glutamate ligase-like protein [Catenovulum maritimum]|uniref:Alpha-L-glutamate ligase n=1 Tax=Catenovulum maritimum TaxID=1513271 RepID=A0A0J8JMK1_9ALTE|nr:alpha-L-glutamate ligase-like protein [Catenovulum maritimum]KMT65841.1 alpha-L-glutamate ligase [Catenovulum maritimum]